MLPISSLLVLALASPGLPAQSAPGSHLSEIAADAETVIRLDLAALRQTELGKRLLALASSRSTEKQEGLRVSPVDEFAEWTEERKLRLGVDLERLTIYARAGDETEPVALLAMSSIAANRLFDDMPEKAGHWCKTIDGVQIHSFRLAGRERGYAHVRSRQQGATVLFSRELDELFRAVAVLGDTSKSLAGGENPISKSLGRKDSFLVLVSRNVRRMTNVVPSSNLVKRSTTLSLEAGEREGKCYAEARIGAKSEKSAGNLADMIQGIVAVARIVARNEKSTDAVKKGRLALLEGLRVSSEGTSIHVRFESPAKQLLELLEADEK